MKLPRSVSGQLAYCATVVAGLALPPNARATQLELSSQELQFGKVIVGETRTLSATLTNTGKQAAKISTVHSDTKAFAVPDLKLPLTLAAGHHVAVAIKFHPAGVGQVAGHILFDKTVASLKVQGRGVRKSVLKANPDRLAFGDVQVGASVRSPIAITNTGTSSVELSDKSTLGSGFATVGLNSPLTLEAGQSFTFTVKFAPKGAGTVKGDLTFTDAEDPNLVIALEGIGKAAGHLADSPAAINFGDVTVGKSAIETGTLSSSGATVKVRSVTSSSSEFVVVGLSLPVTLAAGRSVPYTVKFTPQKTGTASASLSFASTASDATVSEALSGAGVSPEYVLLSWQASASQVAGYNVYRSPQSGGPYTKINAVLDLATSYTDASVAMGQTYYYVVAAVNASGKESPYSNQTQAVIP
ncbi:MAG TPA: choice-of-anchor D domain-containing protein [Terriglobales bacterium]|nr:choice-of-anchor D domain-containing protein [Terriglobales bacterium]